MQEYKYFVSFALHCNGNVAIDNCRLSLTKPLKTYEDIKGVQNKIAIDSKSHLDLTNEPAVRVIYYQLLD